MLERVSGVFVKEIKVIFREKRLLAILILRPVILVSLFGYAFSGEVKNIKVAVVDEDSSDLSEMLISSLHSTDTFSISYFTATRSELMELIRLGKVHAGIYIPKGFQENTNKAIEVYVDESNYNVAATAISKINAITASLSKKFFGGLEVEQRFVFTTKSRMIDFIAPAIIGVVIQMLTLILSSSSISREREEGTLELIFSTPLSSSDLIIGKFLAITALITVDVFIVVALAHYAFDVEVRGSLPLLLFTQFLFLTGTIGVGLIISALSQTQLQGIQASMIFGLVSIFLSGFFYPLESMPEGAKTISYFVPLTYANIAFREVMVKGNGVEVIFPQIVVLSVYTLMSVAGAILALKKVMGGGSSV
jgi:ABC-2 type transport system permease protein